MKFVYLFLLIFLIQSPCYSSNTLNVRANELIYTQNLVFERETRDIAILHFENKGDAESDWIGSGLEYLLNNKLSAIPGFNIIDTSSTQMAFNKLSLNDEAKSNKDSYQKNRLASAHLIISGTFIKTSSQLNVNILYYDEKNNQLIYKEEISGPGETIFSIADKIFHNLLPDYQIRIIHDNPAVFGRALTNNSDAFKSFIKGYIESNKQNPDTELIINYFSDAIAKDNNFWEAYYNLGITYFNSQQYDLALIQFNQIINALPNFDKAYYSRGLIYENQKKIDLAFKDFKKVIEINPDDIKTYCKIAQIDILKEDYPGAKTALDTAFNVNPDYAGAHFEYGNYYVAQNQIRKAVPEYYRAVELDPDNNQYRQMLGESYYRTKSYYNAQYEFQTVLKSDPENADANFMLGLTIYQQAVLEEIVDTFLDMLDRDMPGVATNNTPSSIANNRESAKQRRFFVEIIDAYTKAANSRKNFLQATFNLALVYMEQGNMKEAENHLKATLLIDPTFIAAYNKLAEVYERTNRRHLAIDEYKKIFYLDPSIFVDKPTLGPRQQYISILDICVNDLDNKIKENPNDTRTNIVLAKLFRAQGYNGKAADVLKSILQRNPNNNEAKSLLTEIEKEI